MEKRLNAIIRCGVCKERDIFLVPPSFGEDSFFYCFTCHSIVDKVEYIDADKINGNT